MKLLSKINLIIFVLFTSCTNSKPKYSTRPICIKQEDRMVLAEFVILCAKAANPMSDEEGEDLVRECRISGTEILCPYQKLKWNSNAYRWEP